MVNSKSQSSKKIEISEKQRANIDYRKPQRNIRLPQYYFDLDNIIQGKFSRAQNKSRLSNRAISRKFIIRTIYNVCLFILNDPIDSKYAKTKVKTFRFKNKDEFLNKNEIDKFFRDYLDFNLYLAYLRKFYLDLTHSNIFSNKDYIFIKYLYFNLTKFENYIFDWIYDWTLGLYTSSLIHIKNPLRSQWEFVNGQFFINNF